MTETFKISKLVSSGEGYQAEGPGYRIEVVAEECAENPWHDQDHSGIQLFTWGRHVDGLADKGCPKHPSDLLEEAAEDKNMHLVPLYAHVHGGTVLQAGRQFTGPDARFDSGLAGFFVFDKEVFSKEYGMLSPEQTLDERMSQIANIWVDTLNQWLSGNVWGIRILKVVRCDKCGHDEDELGDSCYGFYGRSGVADGLSDMVPSDIPDRDKLIDKLSSEFYD